MKFLYKNMHYKSKRDNTLFKALEDLSYDTPDAIVLTVKVLSSNNRDLVGYEGPLAFELDIEPMEVWEVS